MTPIDRRRDEAERQARRRAAIDARPAMSPPGPAVGQFRIATWNLNSLRARTPAVDRFLDRTQPDVVCLQETKTAAVAPAATAVFDRHGYEVHHVGAGPYNGVAIASRHALVDVVASGKFGDPVLDREPRVISGRLIAPIPM